MVAIKQYEVLCAWCNTAVTCSEIEHSHGICPKCLNKLLNLPELSWTELNSLPFGIVLLSQDGTVKFYNSAEEDLSLKKADNVMGHNFFTEVAPCTKVKEFYGRFQDFIRSNESSKNFRFNFYFSYGKVVVDIVFVKDSQDNVMVTVKKQELLFGK